MQAMETDKGASWEEVKNWHREWLAEELSKLGPIKFIEGLRVMKQVHEQNVLVNQISNMLEERGIPVEDERQMHFMVGYAADEAEWNEILGMLER